MGLMTHPGYPSQVHSKNIRRATTPLQRGQGACEPNPREFAALCVTYRASGGVASGEELAMLLADRPRDDFVRMARLVAWGQVFSFRWHGDFWVPMFQFELRDLSPRPAAQPVLDVLAAVFDGWALSIWFAQPNPWLAEQRPVDLLNSDLAAVVTAAHRDRFIADG